MKLNGSCHPTDQILWEYLGHTEVEYWWLYYQHEKNMKGVLNRSMRKAQGRMLNHSTFVQHVSVGISHHTDSNCFLLGCLIEQLRGIIFYFDIYIHSIIEFHSFMVCNRELGRGQRQCPKILCFRQRGFISCLVVVVWDISWWNVHPYVDWRWHSW